MTDSRFLRAALAYLLLSSAPAAGQSPLAPQPLTPQQLENLHFQIKVRASTQGILATEFSDSAVPRLLRFSNSRRIGYMNLKGEIVIPPSLDGADEFHHGRIRARFKGKWGFLDHKGEFAIEPKYEELSVIWMMPMQAKINGLWGLLNEKGDWVVEPVYEELRLANKSYEFKKDGKWGVIGPNGEISLPASFEEIRTSNMTGYIAIRVGRKWGIADRSGNIIREPEYDRVFLYDPGLAVAEKEGKQEMFEVSSGTTLLPFADQEIYPTLDRNRWIIKKDRVYGVVDRANHPVIKQEYDLISSRGAGYLEVSKGRMKALASISGKFLTDFIYQEIGYFRDGMVSAKIAEKWGYLDTAGKVAVEPQFDSVYGFSQGVAPVTVDGKRGYIDKKGAYIIAPKFEEAYDFFPDGVATAKLNGEYVYIDRRGNTIGRLLQPEVETSETFFKQ